MGQFLSSFFLFIHLLVISVPISHCFNHCIIVLQFGSASSAHISFFFRKVLDTLSPLFFHLYFWISLSSTTMKTIGTSYWNCINLLTNLLKELKPRWYSLPQSLHIFMVVKVGFFFNNYFLIKRPHTFFEDLFLGTLHFLFLLHILFLNYI